MVDKKFKWRPSEDVRTHICRICKSEFQTNRAADCHCGDECRAEAKRRHAKAHRERIKILRRQREEEKAKKKLHREIKVERESSERVSTSAAVRSETNVSIKITSTPKRNKSTKDYIGIQRPTSQRDKRLCLKCQKLFDSEGKGNRICTKCDNQNVSIGGRESKFTPERRGIRFGNY